MIQNIRPEDCYLYVPKPASLDFPPDVLSNIATIIQDNFCIDCTDVLQENLALVIQNINPENVILVPRRPADR